MIVDTEPLLGTNRPRIKMTGKNILIVDDDVKAARAMGIRLHAAGYEVHTATDGVTARKIADTDPPDLIIADVLMPVGTGFAMAYRLRQLSFSAPVIFVTASRDPRLRKAAEEFGAAGFIEKPYEPVTLLAVVNHALLARSVESQKAAAKSVRENKPERRILVVEDDHKFALALYLRLQTARYDTTVAFDALTGAQAALGTDPDLIVLDITLPGGSGFSVAEEIRRLIPATVPIVFMTASKEPGLRERALSIGAVGFFEKPFETQAMLSTIRKAIGDPT